MTFSRHKNGKAEAHVADNAADDLGDQEPVKPEENILRKVNFSVLLFVKI